MTPRLHLGARRSIDGRSDLGSFHLPAHDLLTHAVVVGMTGGGKTGLVTVMVEEALRAGVPALVIDVKGDLPNLKLAFPSFDAERMRPWVEPEANDEDGIADPHVVEAALARHAEGLRTWSIGEAELAADAASTMVRVVTPGSDAEETLRLLSALERGSDAWTSDATSLRARLSAAISLACWVAGVEPPTNAAWPARVLASERRCPHVIRSLPL